MSREYRHRKKSRTTARSSSPSSTFAWMLFGILIGLFVAIFGYWKLTVTPAKQAQATSVQTPAQIAHQTTSTLKKEKVAAPVVAAPEFDFYTVLPKMEVAATTKEGNVATKPPVMPSAPASIVADTSVSSTQPSAPAVPIAAAPAAPAPVTPPVPVTQNPSTSASHVVSPAAPSAIKSDAIKAEPKTTTTQVVVKQPPTEHIASPSSTVISEPKIAPAKSAASTIYALQLGLFKSYAEADRLKAALTMSGLEVSIQPYTRNGQIYNRVMMGPYPSKPAALQQRAALQKNHIASVLVKTP